jgi:predicted peroxiredoxin
MGSKVLQQHYTEFYYATIVTLLMSKRIIFATKDGVGGPVAC